MIDKSEELWRSLRERRVLQRLAISDSGFLFDPGSGQSYSLNATAQQLLRLLQQADSLTTVYQELQGQYGLMAVQAQVAVGQFLEQLTRYL